MVGSLLNWNESEDSLPIEEDILQTNFMMPKIRKPYACWSFDSHFLFHVPKIPFQIIIVCPFEMDKKPFKYGAIRKIAKHP